MIYEFNDLFFKNIRLAFKAKLCDIFEDPLLREK